MTDTFYHFRDIRVAETPAPSPRAELHRELGRTLAELNEQVLRLDASDDQLRDYIQQARELKAAMAEQGQRDYGTTLRRLLDGEGTGDDVTDLVDFEILTGKASPLIIASSTEECPSTTTPSTGTFSPTLMRR